MTARPAPGPSGRTPTIRDVAARAGVSPGTVSKALNGRGRLRPETRDLVRRVADDLGFRPHHTVPAAPAGRTYTVGLLTTDSVGRFSLPVLLGAEDALGADRISVFLSDTRGDRIRERHYVRTLLERRIDGLIVTGRRTDPRPPLDLPSPVPVVYALGPSTDPDDISVVPDDGDGARQAVEHLLATGRRRIAHLAGPPDHHASTERAEHVTLTLRAAGLDLAGGQPYFGAWSEAWGRQATAIALRADPALDALCCANDLIARGAADALRESGRRVPDDVAVVGYDNWEIMAAATRPPLTTVDLNLEELGRTAALLLTESIEGRPEPGVRRLPCRLVVRESA
ncbi:LacI family DNA-binding transcriptional regulator [Streptomyces sp. RFCAC02]|uniref:LacI family DNA-binding transcriptional regulator n=1 Tax=Streptomyces sp. RFCAC02 TaxID=2499143 RepID=UPI00102201DF|nr:LacI family DNA-binding transcriptional regulator [Streptomyces sp. RFCAC02]